MSKVWKENKVVESRAERACLMVRWRVSSSGGEGGSSGPVGEVSFLSYLLVGVRLE